MAKKICECQVQIKNWILLIDVISTRILIENSLHYMLLNIDLSDTDLPPCCIKNIALLQCLQALFTEIYVRSKTFSSIPSKVIRRSLDAVFTNGYRLQNSVTRK